MGGEQHLIEKVSSHTNNKKDVLALGEGPTAGINDSVGAAEKKFSINFI